MTNQLAALNQHASHILVHWLAVITIWLLTAPTIAADTEEPRLFKDWKLRCKQPEGADKKICQITQHIVLKESKRTLLRVAVDYIPEQDDRLGVVLTLPLGIALPPGIILTVDNGEPRRLPIEYCIRAGCRVRLTIDDTLLAAFKAGIEAQVTFHDISRQPVGVPVSLRGFTAGLNALTKLRAADNRS